MGCFYTKAKPRQYSSNGTNAVQVLKPADNGISHFNTHNLLPKNETPATDTIDVVPKRRRAPESSHSLVLSPRPLATCPRTPEEDRLSPLSVQYAEDLEAVNNLPDVITVATMAPKTKKVNVSTLSLSSAGSQRQESKPGLSNNDISIEDLDTELDQYSKYSQARYPLKTGERINPPVTDVLLPRRKTKQVDTNDRQQGTTDKAKTKQAKSRSREKSNIKKRAGKRTKSGEKRSKSRDRIDYRKEDRVKTPEGVELDLEITELNDESVTIENNQDIKTTLIEPLSISKDDENADSIEQTTKRENDKADKAGANEENNSRVSSAKTLVSSSVFVPKDVYQKELEKVRLKRKRKHANTRKQTVDGSVQKSGEEKTQEELKRGLKAKPWAESRPGSGSSVWTLESTHSLASQASSSSVNLYTSTSQDNIISPVKHRENSAGSKFSYVPTGTTPLSFTQDAIDQDAQLMDLETDFDFDDTAEDSVIVSARVMDPFHGVKPYITKDNVLEKSGINDIPSGSSTSYLFTKQKLLYSRFARRPNSETYARLEGKPPLPPGGTLRARPSSDTADRNTTFSRYFTSDLDIH